MSGLPCKNEACNSYGQPHPNCRCYGGYAEGGMAQPFCSSTKAHKEGCQYAKGGVVGGFSLHEESPTHYVIKHPKGDTLRIAKTGLSEKLHEHIKRMSKMGETQNLAEGGEVEDQTSPTPSPAPAPQAPVTININGGNREPASQATPAPQPQPSGRPPAAAQPKPEPTVGQQMQSAMQGHVSPSPAPENPKIAQQIAQQAGPQNVNLASFQQPAPQQAPQMAMPSLPALNASAQIQKVIKDEEQKRQEMYQNATQVMQGINDQSIDFNRLWHNKSTGSKILAGIGMILGGAGAGVTGGPNPVLEMINKEIERDVEEQKANIGKKATLLDKYIALHGDMSTAARRQVEDLQAATAAKMSEFQMKMQQGMLQGAQGGAGQTAQYLNYLRMFNPEMAKSVESRWLPNFNTMTNIPVPDKDRNALAEMKDFDDTMTELEAFSKRHSGSLNPAIVNAGKALAARAKDQWRQANNQGVFREAEQKFDEKMIPSDPTKFFADFRTLPQYEVAKNANRQMMVNTLNKFMEGQMSPKTAFSGLTPRKTYAASDRKSK